MSFLYLNEDARILDQIRQGEEQALMTLYSLNERPVTAFVVRNSGSPDDAQDMLQESLVVLWERVRSGRYEHASQISTFILGTVRNMWLRQLARKRREGSFDATIDETPSDEPSQIETMMESEEAAAIASAMERLGDPCKKLLLLFYWEECSMEEIAAQMGFANADTVKSKKYQCKKALEKLLVESQ
jgi:RNA polymerase sigma factor (sigma-70 family)